MTPRYADALGVGKEVLVKDVIAARHLHTLFVQGICRDRVPEMTERVQSILLDMSVLSFRCKTGDELGM